MEELYPVVPEDFERAGAASMAIKDLLKQLGLPPEFIRRVAIGAYEGEMNCLIHGGGGQVKLQVEPDAIRVQVSDDGPGIPDIPQAMQEGWSTASAKIHSMGFGAGMGLPNMKKVADQLDIQSTVGKGTKVTMTFSLPRERRERQVRLMESYLCSVQVDREKCTGCLLCVKNCLVQASGSGRAKPDYFRQMH